MIGIICAEKEELNEIIKFTKNIKKEKIGSLEFITGEILDKKCVLALSGVGKVHGTMCVQSMIIRYNPKAVINIGVAGAVDHKLNIGDIVIGTSVVQHDFDVSAFPERKKGEISGIGKVEIPCAKRILEILLLASQNIKNIKTHCGTVLTGDQFINSTEKLNQIRNDFNGIACEMEAGAIGQVCFLNNVDFGIIKSISDTADKNSSVDFKKFIECASKNSVNLLMEFIKLYRD